MEPDTASPGEAAKVMEIPAILQQLERNTGPFPRAALNAAIARREEITPALLHVLQDTIDHLESYSEDDDRMAHLYAMLLLAQFREPRAYPLIVELFRQARERSYDLGGDFITEDLGRVLASVCDGNLDGIKALIEDELVDEYVRGAGLQALVVLVNVNEARREDVMDYFASLFRGKLVREPSQVWDSLVGYSTDLYPEEVQADIEEAFADDLIDPMFIDEAEIQLVLRQGKEATLAETAENTHLQLITDVIASTQWWACFDENNNNYLPAQPVLPSLLMLDELRSASSSSSSYVPPLPSVPYQRPGPKIGRNDPCPCGSGKKYKKCCGG